MSTVAIRNYTGQGLVPVMDAENALKQPVRLPAGSTIAKGTVLGQTTTVSATNEVQTITFTGTPTGGTFKLGFAGEVTGNITYSTTAATLAANISAALAALTSIGSASNIAVSEHATTPTVTFQGAMAALDQPLMTVVANGLTGGTSPALSVAETTKGIPAGGLWAAYDDSASNGLQTAKAVLEYAVTTDTFGNHTVGGGELSETSKYASAFFSGTFRCSELTGLDAAGVADLGRLISGNTSALSASTTILRIG